MRGKSLIMSWIDAQPQQGSGLDSWALVPEEGFRLRKLRLPVARSSVGHVISSFAECKGRQLLFGMGELTALIQCTAIFAVPYAFLLIQ